MGVYCPMQNHPPGLFLTPYITPAGVRAGRLPCPDLEELNELLEARRSLTSFCRTLPKGPAFMITDWENQPAITQGPRTMKRDRHS
jgi:hypothetical protein